MDTYLPDYHNLPIEKQIEYLKVPSPDRPYTFRFKEGASHLTWKPGDIMYHWESTCAEIRPDLWEVVINQCKRTV